MANNIFIEKYKSEFQSAIDFLKQELKSIRTGRASASLVEGVSVHTYGAIQPLSQLATIGIPESSSILIDPWDKSILKDIEVGLNNAHLGLSVVNTGERLIAKVPMMTEEVRKEMVKLLGKKIEETRITIRKVRDNVREDIMRAEKNKEISEDDKYQHLAELDEFTVILNKEIDKTREEKEVDIMNV